MKKVPKKERQITIERTPDIIYYSFTGRINESVYPSHLLPKINKIESRKYNFIIEKVGPIHKETSHVISAFNQSEFFCYADVICYKVDSKHELIKSIKEIQYAKITANNINHQYANLIIGIEEIIFYEQQDAETLMSYINDVRQISYFWQTIDKRPSYMYREANRIFYVRT